MHSKVYIFERGRPPLSKNVQFSMGHWVLVPSSIWLFPYFRQISQFISTLFPKYEISYYRHDQSFFHSNEGKPTPHPQI